MDTHDMGAVKDSGTGRGYTADGPLIRRLLPQNAAYERLTGHAGKDRTTQNGKTSKLAQDLQIVSDSLAEPEPGVNDDSILFYADFQTFFHRVT